jgi:hypothetical protein
LDSKHCLAQLENLTNMNVRVDARTQVYELLLRNFKDVGTGWIDIVGLISRTDVGCGWQERVVADGQADPKELYDEIIKEKVPYPRVNLSHSEKQASLS